MSTARYCIASAAPLKMSVPGGGMQLPGLYLRTLERAAQIVGGEQALAVHLKVTPSHLALWLKGLEEPTTEAFLRAVDLVSAHELAQLPQPRAVPQID